MKTNKSNYTLAFIALALLSTLNSQLSTVSAQGTAFTYQGRLTVGGNSSTNGIYDFQFQVFDTAGTGTGTSLGSPNPNSLSGVAVSNGLFTVLLDFGAGVFTGPARWLQISVRTNGVGVFTALTPREALTPTPYAIYSANAAQLGGQTPASYVAKAGDTMTGTLNLPANGLAVGGNQLFTSGGNVGIGTTSPGYALSVQAVSPASDVIEWKNGSFQLGRLGWAQDQNSGWLGLLSSGALNVDIRASGNSYFKGGNVGIGTTSPNYPLDVNGTVNSTFAQITAGSPTLQFYSPGNEIFQLKQEGTSLGGASKFSVIENCCGTPRYLMSVLYNGNVGIGTTTPAAKLDVVDSQAYVRFLSTANDLGSVLELRNNTASLTATLGSINFVGAQAAMKGQISCGVDGGISLYTGNGYVTISPGGVVSVPVLQINGADVAEPFEMSTKDLPKGSVVIIDEENPGKVKLSDRTYDKRVAGILSGANGVNSGILLKQQGFNDGGQNVALSGRVYALADAANGSIKPGDLLTTSATPGHCMKVTNPAKAQGAIIGKAMSSLKEGKGMVLVLVSLQ